MRNNQNAVSSCRSRLPCSTMPLRTRHLTTLLEEPYMHPLASCVATPWNEGLGIVCPFIRESYPVSSLAFWRSVACYSWRAYFGHAGSEAPQLWVAQADRELRTFRLLQTAPVSPTWGWLPFTPEPPWYGVNLWRVRRVGSDRLGNCSRLVLWSRLRMSVEGGFWGWWIDRTW